MTARRQGSASAAAAAFGRALPPTKPAGQTPAPEKAAAVPATPAVKPSKYTMLLSQDDLLLWDRLLMQLRAESGRRIDKSELVRILVSLTADDATLRAQVVAEIQARS